MTSRHDPQTAPAGPLDVADGAFAAAHDRRRFLKRAAVAGAAAWAAPTVLSSPAFAQGSNPCTGPQGFFTWDRAAYTQGMRSGGPGGGSDMTSSGGWTSHPTFDDVTYTNSISGMTITYKLEGITFLNTGGTTPQAHGVDAAGAGGSATFKSYRISKDGTPTLNDIMTIIVQFSSPVGCPTMVLGDLDNNLQTTGTNGCTGAGSGASPYWADRLAATAYPGLNASGTPVSVTRIATAGGTNVTPGVGSSGPWTAIQCASIPQSSNVSNLAIQANGTVQEMRIQYFSAHQDTVGTGNQHIALGDITFYL